MLEIKNISFSYSGNRVLKDINMQIPRGKVVGLIGENGAGKSTLFYNVLGLLRPDCGEILYDGAIVSFDKASLRKYRQKINMVMQDPDRQIFYSKVYDDIIFPLRNLGVPEEIAEKRVMQTMERLRISDLADKPVHYLSYGQKKRVAIAGVLAMNCETVLFDEPTAGLDPRLGREMVSLIKELCSSGVSMVISSHDMDFIYEICDYVYVICGGEIIAKGGADEVFCYESALLNAGLAVPTLVRMHLHAGVPLFKSETELYEYLKCECR